VLHIINFVTSPWRLLGILATSSWGIGLAAHGLATYRWMPFLGKEWEQRKIRELMDQEPREGSR
jgi:hypothetical protein